MTQPSLVPVILSGGAGSRLWPLSREASPKPFMPLPDGQTLLGKTARARWRCPASPRSSPSPPRALFRDQGLYAGLSTPCLRRPATCSSHSAATPRPRWRWRWQWKRGTADAVLLILAADHLIHDQRVSPPRRARRGAGAHRRAGHLASRRRAETGFGYIECGAAVATRTRSAAYAALRFVEKPPLDRRRRTSRPARSSGTRACSAAPRAP